MNLVRSAERFIKRIDAMMAVVRSETSNQRPPQPKGLAKYSHINRYWDAQQKIWAAKLMPGEYYVGLGDEEVIVTTLGSCVAACIWDEYNGIGGMNHFMLPSDPSQPSMAFASSDLDRATRYGNVAMEHLINDILKLGGKRENLKVKIFGGGQMFAAMSDIGQRNILFVEHYIYTENLEKVASDVGNVWPRKVAFFPASGRVRVKRFQNLNNATLAVRENQYLQNIAKDTDGGDVELF